MLNASMPRQYWVTSLIMGGLSAVLYASTLMLQISGCGHEYCLDVGEFQLALAVWGTVHHTGYPLYMFIGSPFVTALNWIGVPFTTGASLYSLVWAVLTIIINIAIVIRLTNNVWLAGGAGLWLAVLQPFWIHGSIAEVYSLSMALTVIAIWLAINVRHQWSNRTGLWLALTLGLGVAHHRLLILLVPILGLYLLPTVRRIQGLARWLGLATLAFVAGFLPYIDLWWRAERGARWLYSYTNDWDNFWFLFLGREVSGLQRPNFSSEAIFSAANDVFQLYQRELSWPGLILAIVGGGLLIARHRWSAVGLWGGVFFAYSLFAMVLRQAVLLEATLMPGLLALVMLAALGLNELPERWRTLAPLSLFGISTLLAYQNYPVVLALARDEANARYVQQVEQLDAPVGAIFMEPWGGQYFAVSYAHIVEGRFPQWRFVDHRANFGELAQETQGAIYTSQDTLFSFGPAWWEQNLGKPLRINSAGPELVALSTRPFNHTALHNIVIGDGLALVDWEVHLQRASEPMQVSVYWQASQPPTQNYSTYVHISDKPEILAPEDLIASHDSSLPVYGWYPMSSWQVNEIVREDHLIALPPDREVQGIFIGMYSQDPNGNFIQLGRVGLHNVAGSWVLKP